MSLGVDLSGCRTGSRPQWLDTLEIGLQDPRHSKDKQSGASLLASISQYSRGFEAEFAN